MRASPLTQLFNLNLAIHSLFVQALGGNLESYHPFIHEQRPHPGQIFVASAMRQLLSGSGFLSDSVNQLVTLNPQALIQDRSTSNFDRGNGDGSHRSSR